MPSVSGDDACPVIQIGRSAFPLSDMLRQVQADHAAGRVDASSQLAAIERRIVAAERKLARAA